VAKGHRVAYLGENHPAFLETLFACGQLGAIFVPLNTRLAPPEIRFQLDDCSAAALVYAGDLGAVAQAAAEGTALRRLIAVGAGGAAPVELATVELLAPVESPRTMRTSWHRAARNPWTSRSPWTTAP
jgi:fatty-acyl-CoA synthase